MTHDCNRSHGSKMLDTEGNSALAELGRATSSLQAVLLTFLHTRIAGEEASFLQGSTQFRISLAQGTGNAVTNRAGLTGHTAAADIFTSTSKEVVPVSVRG